MPRILIYTFANNYEYLLYSIVMFKSIRSLKNGDSYFLKLYIPSFNKEVMSFITKFKSDIINLNINIVPCNDLINWSIPRSKFQKLISQYPLDFIKILGLFECEFEKAVFFDSDMLIIGDFEQSLKSEFAFTDGLASPLNSGFLVFTPDHKRAIELLSWVSEERFSFKGGWSGNKLSADHSYSQWCQGLLYAFFCMSKYKCKYDILSRERFNCQNIKEYRKDTKILHFTSSGKPLNYMFSNTLDPKWIEHSSWHDKWLNMAETLDGFDKVDIYNHFVKKKPLRKRIGHKLKKYWRK